MHNTVTIDETSQRREKLSGEEVPKVAYFFAGPVARFAELHGDYVYPQTSVYRRSVALIEDVEVDRFDVRGGKTHDWMLHHAGTSPGSPRHDAKRVRPEAWLYSGTANIAGRRRTTGTPDGRWTT